MEIVNKKISVAEVTLTLSEEDFQVIDKWQSVLESATKENAYGLVKDFAGILKELLSFLTGTQPYMVGSTSVIDDEKTQDAEKTQDKPVCNVKRQSNKISQRNKIKVTITNIDDNHVFHVVVRMFGRFVKCDGSMSIESQLKQNKGAIYLDNEQELDDLLNTLLMYNLSDGHVPIQIQVE